MKKHISIGIAIIFGILLGYGACWHLNPRTISLEDIHLVNADFVQQLEEATCADEINAERKIYDEKFKTAWVEKMGSWKNFETCECDEQVIIIESNCDTAALDAELEECQEEFSACYAERDTLIRYQEYCK